MTRPMPCTTHQLELLHELLGRPVVFYNTRSLTYYEADALIKSRTAMIAALKSLAKGD